MPSFFSRLFGTKNISADVEQEGQQAWPPFLPLKKHPPIVHWRGDIHGTKKLDTAPQSSNAELASTLEQSRACTVPAKRHASLDADTHFGVKKRRRDDRSLIQAPRCDHETDQGHAADSSEASVEPTSDKKHVLSEGPEMTETVQAVRATIEALHDEAATTRDDFAGPIKPMSQQNATEQILLDIVDAITPEDSSVAGTPTVMHSKPWSKNDIGPYEPHISTNGHTLARTRAEAYQHAKHATSHREESRTASSCPSGRLVGIGMWPGSSRIPGQRQIRHTEKDIIQLPIEKPKWAAQT